MRATRDEEFERFVRGERVALVRFATTLTAGDPHLPTVLPTAQVGSG